MLLDAGKRGKKHSSAMLHYAEKQSISGHNTLEGIQYSLTGDNGISESADHFFYVGEHYKRWTNEVDQRLFD